MGVIVPFTLCILGIHGRKKFTLEVKLPTVWTDEAAEVGRVREEQGEERRSKKRESQKKEDQGARKGRKVAKLCISNTLWLRRLEK